MVYAMWRQYWCTHCGARFVFLPELLRDYRDENRRVAPHRRIYSCCIFIASVRVDEGQGRRRRRDGWGPRRYGEGPRRHGEGPRRPGGDILDAIVAGHGVA